MKDTRNIVFETFDQVEATIIESILESHGIEVFVYKESLSTMYGFYSPTIGRIRLGVHGDQMERAAEIIGDYRTGEGEEPGEGAEE